MALGHESGSVLSCGAKNTEEARGVDKDGNYDQYVCEKLATGKLIYKDNDKATDADKDKDKPKQ